MNEDILGKMDSWKGVSWLKRKCLSRRIIALKCSSDVDVVHKNSSRCADRRMRRRSLVGSWSTATCFVHHATACCCLCSSAAAFRSSLWPWSRSVLSRPCVHWAHSMAHSGPLCHALSLSLSLWTSILHCHSPGVATVACCLRYSCS